MRSERTIMDSQSTRSLKKSKIFDFKKKMGKKERKSSFMVTQGLEEIILKMEADDLITYSHIQKAKTFKHKETVKEPLISE